MRASSDRRGSHCRREPAGRLLCANGGGPVNDDDRRDAGRRVRSEVLGEAHVERSEAAATTFTQDFQDLITRVAWGDVWARPGLDRRTRSVITVTALMARGHWDELALH